MSIRRTAYNIFFRLSPLLIVILIEAALRFFGVGNSLIMFRDSEDGFKKELNPKHYHRYVSERQFEKIEILSQDFPKVKDPNTYRVFLVSDHTLIAAVPEAQTEPLVQDFNLLNGKKVDLIQITVPFTDSFAVKRMLRSLKRYDADACLVFTGQNEFYGLPQKSIWMRDIRNYWGVSSYATMKNHRLVQILDKFLYLNKDIQKQFPPENPDAWLVEADSMVYREIYSYFNRNLKAMSNKSNFPIFYVKLPVNLKHQPYRSFFDDKELIDQDFTKECSTLLKEADKYTLNRWLEDLYAWEPETAIYYYCKAMIEEHNNELDLAHKDYLKAVRLDAFKVRMDTSFTNLINKAGMVEPHRIIDLEAFLKASSDNPSMFCDCFINGIELDAQSKLLLSELIRLELTTYFSDEINKE